MKFDCAIIGGGIVGLATAMAIARRGRGMNLIVLEKERELALHQTGRNSGVIHSGIYYKPGSLKARFAREGNKKLVQFCRDHGIAHEICGKVIVATRPEELDALENLYQRGLQNELEVHKLDAAQLSEIEPHVRSLAALRVPSTGIVNYREVSAKYAEITESEGGVIRKGVRIRAMNLNGSGHIIDTSDGVVNAGFVVNCGGLHSDRIARQAGLEPQAKIVPFRGEYYELVPDKRHLVNSLVYPVPNPAFPFLGVHFTRMIDGSVHAGPNAVLALKREGYRKSDFNGFDALETLRFGGFWKLARTYYREGLQEAYRSFSKKAFVRSLQELIPEVQSADLTPTHSGVRAQALMPDGRLVDDFLIVDGKNSIHVCNAPSPAATASLEIGDAIATRTLNQMS